MLKILNPQWQGFLHHIIDSVEYKELIATVEKKYVEFSNAIFPAKNEVFRAFEFCNLDELKVVIIGQDPYPTRGHANGLCFSLNPTVSPLAKSLVNIFRELESDVHIPTPANGDLSSWAKQGVLLLNTILTVKEGQPQSHKGIGWEHFTDKVIETIATEMTGVVFLLWGNYAIKKGKKIDRLKHLVLESGHPSPLSANQGKWFGNKHFSQTNEYLQKIGKKQINWELDARYDLFNGLVDSL